MSPKNALSRLLLCCLLACLCTNLGHTADPPTFKSHLFEDGTLVYSDDFDTQLDRDWWQPRTKTWKVKDGQLIGVPDFKTAEAAQKALGRDHHLGLGPVIRFNKLPEKFVLQMRFRFAGETYKPARPKIDIGHHINSLVFTQDGYTLKLSGGKQCGLTKTESALNRWVEILIEFEEGRLSVAIDGDQKLFEHAQVSMKDRTELTFKALENTKSQLTFDHVRLWKVQ